MQTVIPHYIDEGILRKQDRVPLAAFLDDHDRTDLSGGAAPFFSGREPEMNIFRAVAGKLLRGRRSNATVMVEGPPGAGKSALLAQFREDMAGFPPVGANARRWLPVPLDGASATVPERLMRIVDNAVAVRLADAALAQPGVEEREGAVALLFRTLETMGWQDAEQSVRDKGAFLRRVVDERGISAFGLGTRGTAARSGMSIHDVADRRGAAWREWQIVLLIDEAQGISNDVPGAVPGTLAAIHQGLVSGLHISFCAFGLPGTEAALGRVNVSRMTERQKVRLGGLEEGASRLAVNRCFAQYGVRNGEHWKATILTRSANWPQHLAVYLNAALAVLSERAERADLMGDVRGSSLREAMEIGDASRAAYYMGRMNRLDIDSPWNSHYAKELALWMRQHHNGAPDIGAKAVLDFLQGAPLALSKGETAGFLDAAVHAGLMERGIDGRLHFPMPSFVGHLLDERLPEVVDAQALRPPDPAGGRQGRGWAFALMPHRRAAGEQI